MRTMRLVMIIVWSVVALGIIAALVGGILFNGNVSTNILQDRGGASMVRSAPTGMELLVDQRFSGDSVDSFSLSLGADDVDVYPSEDGDVTVLQYGRNLTDDRVISASQRGSTVKVERGSGRGGLQFGINTQSTVEVYLPDQLYQELSLHLSSGSLYIHTDLSAGKFNLKLSSGNVKSNSLVTADRAEIRLTSGSARLGGLHAEKYTLEASSGLLEVNGLTGSGTTNLTSGTMRLFGVEITGSLSSKISSGNLNLELAGNPSLEFSGKKSSGNVNTYFEHYSDSRDKELTATVGDGPYLDLSVQVTSGNVKITSA